VSRILTRRLIIVAVMVLAAMVLLEVARRFILGDLSSGLLFLVTTLVVCLAACLGVWIDAYLSLKVLSAPRGHFENERLEAELEQLNQELAFRTQEQTNELARLNVELQLQIAMQKQAEDMALANEERFRSMADNIQEGLTIIESGHVVYVNQRACEIFGDCPEGELHGRIFTFAAPEEQHRLREKFLEAGPDTAFPPELEYWIVRQDGSRRCVRERYSNSSSDGVDRTFIVTSDITEAVQAYQNLENAVEERTRQLSTLLDVSHRIASTLELEPLLHLILDQMQAIIPYSGAAIFTLEENRLKAVAYQVPRLPVQKRPLYLSLERAGIYRKVVTEKMVISLDDVEGDTPLLRAFLESSVNPELRAFDHARSWIGIPLVFRGQVTGLLSLTHSEPGFYLQSHNRLAMTIADQVAIAIENARLYEQAQNLAVLEERNRIARELHDSVTQLLYGITLYCTATSRSIRGGNYTQVEQNLDEIKDNALQALQEMRLLILELNPPLLQKAGLVAALQASLEVIETRTGLETELKIADVDRLPRAVETELYRIAMEALNNLVRYAHARKVTVDLSTNDGHVCLEICDNGVGFDLSRANSSGGMGLHNMEQRARQIGGRLEINSTPGAGTRIRIDAPLKELAVG
jgi:PAS domain S-box-containing protein